jgi:hypothetical protein
MLITDFPFVKLQIDHLVPSVFRGGFLAVGIWEFHHKPVDCRYFLLMREAAVSQPWMCFEEVDIIYTSATFYLNE